MLREAVSNVSGALSLPLLQRAVAPPGLQESALGALGALGADSKAYRAWTWETYKRVMKFAALIAGVHLLLILRDMESVYQQLVNVVMIAQMICLFVLTLKLPLTWKIEAHEWARWVIISFSLGKIVMTWVLFFSDEHPGDSVVRVCKKWLDTITNMGIAVPTLAMADFSTGVWLVFLGLHISASAPFYVKWLHYSVFLAVFKVVFIQGLSLIAYAMMERSKFKAYVKYREQALQKKLATTEDAPSPVGASTSQGASTLKRVASAESSSVQELRQPTPRLVPPSLRSDARAIPSTEQPISSSVQELHQFTPELMFTSQAYVSRVKKRKAVLKIRCDIEPGELLAGPNIKLLHSLLKSSLPSNFMVESAVRHGCVVVSVDLCELVRIDDETSLLSSTATEHEVASKVAGSVLKWLHASDARRLKDGTVITIQVNNLVFEGCWDASTRSVHLLEEKQGLPTLEQCSITLYEPAILLPALQPTQQHPACPEEYSVSFIASVSAPADVELVGWQDKKGASDVVEGSSRKEEVVLQVLAHARGMFLLVEVTEVSRADNGERTVQVCVSLPGSLLVHGQCLRMELELVRSSTLLCSRSVLLMGIQLGEELQELKGWAASNVHMPEPVSTFLEDLAEFLSFQSLFAPSSVPPSTVEIDGSSSNSSACLVVFSEEGLLPMLKAEAQTPEILVMMAEVGMELLQHAVSWGMAALAEQLLTGLMAAPLCMPFDAVACGQLPHVYPLAKEVVEQQQQQQQQQRVQEQQKELGDEANLVPAQHVQPPVLFSGNAAALDIQPSDDSAQGQDGVCPVGPPSCCTSRSLITCALLSYDQQCLARVLEWGRKYGGPHGFAWPWSVVDASGYSPLQIIERLPVGHVLLEQLLADPTARPAALHAQAVAQQMGGQHRGSQLQQRPTATAEAAASHPALQAQRHSGSVDASAKQEDECAGSTAQAGSSKLHEERGTVVKRRTTDPQPAPSPAAPPEHAYPSGVLKVALKALVFGFGKHGDIKEADYRDWCFGSQAHGPKKRKIYMTIGKIVLWTLLLLSSMGLLPSVLAQKLAFLYLDWAVEVLMYRLIDQVQLKTLLLERAVSCFINIHMYTRLGFSLDSAFCRALALSLCSLIVGLALDIRNRCIYLKIHALSVEGLHDIQGKKFKVQ